MNAIVAYRVLWLASGRQHFWSIFAEIFLQEISSNAALVRAIYIEDILQKYQIHFV